MKVYNHVRISIPDNQHLLLSSRDGKGTIVVSKASCTSIAAMLRCLPYLAELDQNGNVLPIVLVSGTVWLNLSTETHQLPLSSTQLAPGGVVLALDTKRGTHVSLTGTLDEVVK